MPRIWGGTTNQQLICVHHIYMGPFIFDASTSCSQNHISPEDVTERTGFCINPHILVYDGICIHCFIL